MTTNSSSDIAADAIVEMTKNLGFMVTLPNDIVLKIFSYLSQKDCLMCMTVCRAWDHTIPEYTQQLWKHIKLTGKDVYRNHPRRERCLGTHVKHVDLNTNDLYFGSNRSFTKVPGRPFSPLEPVEEIQMCHLMQRLVDWGCTQIETLEIRMFRFDTVHSAFSDALSNLASHLATFKMTGSQSTYLLPHILNACPELTHFEGLRTGGMKRPSNLPTIPIKHDTKIEYLRLDYPMNKHQLECILKKSPDLRCFITELQLYRVSSSDSFDINLLLSWCPKINYLATTFGVGPSPAYASISDHVGLRSLGITTCHPVDQITQCLARSQNTLEYLYISKHSDQHDDDLSSVFSSLQLPKLYTIFFSHIRIDAASLVTLLNHCPSLEELRLTGQDMILNPAAIHLLDSMNNLRTLSIYDILDDELSLLTILERFPALEKLDVSETCLSVTIPDCVKDQKQLKHLKLYSITWKHIQEADPDGDVACFIKHLTKNSSLELINIYEGPALGYKSLRALTMIPTLKVLVLPVDNKSIRDDEAVEFIRALGGTSIEKLCLENFNDLSFSALDALAQLPFLRIFSSLVTRIRGSEHYQRVSKKGLQQVLSNSSSLEAVFFNDMILEDDGKPLARIQVEELMQQQNPQYMNASGINRWETKKLVLYDGAKIEADQESRHSRRQCNPVGHRLHREYCSVREVEIRRIAIR